MLIYCIICLIIIICLNNDNIYILILIYAFVIIYTIYLNNFDCVITNSINFILISSLNHMIIDDFKLKIIKMILAVIIVKF